MSLRHDAEWINHLKEESTRFQQLSIQINKVVVGQQDAITSILVALLCNGHILLEGVPGVAKTTMIKTLATALGLSFKRIQFTPDLLPADLIGTLIYNQKTQDFETRQGPIFANLILADEINRAPAKVQSALLEAMQEHQVTIGSTTYKLDEPFLVFATQNPIEQEGTYRLPEAQVDRFMAKLIIGYPSKQEEKDIIARAQHSEPVQQVLTKEDILRTQKLIKDIYIDDTVTDYILNIIFATRTPQTYGLHESKRFIQYGVSPRATLALYDAVRAHAFLKKRHFVTPDDVKVVALDVICHRLATTYEAEAEGITPHSIMSRILKQLPTP